CCSSQTPTWQLSIEPQNFGVPEQTPPWQVSFSVQNSPSSQGWFSPVQPITPPVPPDPPIPPMPPEPPDPPEPPALLELLLTSELGPVVCSCWPCAQPFAAAAEDTSSVNQRKTRFIPKRVALCRRGANPDNTFQDARA